MQFDGYSSSTHPTNFGQINERTKSTRCAVCNKIGTYLKALAAQDNGVPFYVALPTPTIDWTLQDGVREIPIEERAASEVTHIRGLADDGQITPCASRHPIHPWRTTASMSRPRDW
jgi:methylthioribose-1-phosphate isomerase